MESVQDRVLRVIATTARKPLEDVRPESTFAALGIDSLDRLNILFELEGEFDIQIDDTQAKKVTSIEQMITGVQYLVDVKEARAAGLPEPPPPPPLPDPPASVTEPSPAAPAPVDPEEK